MDRIEVWVMLLTIAQAAIGGLVYVWRRRADREITETQATASNAEAAAKNVNDLVAVLGRLVTTVEVSNHQASEERRLWREQQEEFHQALTIQNDINRKRLEQNDAMLGKQDGFGQALVTLTHDVTAGRAEAVREVQKTMNARYEEHGTELASVKRELADMQAKLDEVLALLRAKVEPEPEAEEEAAEDAGT